MVHFTGILGILGLLAMMVLAYRSWPTGPGLPLLNESPCHSAEGGPLGPGPADCDRLFGASI
jgi:hypothetical protein